MLNFGGVRIPKPCLQFITTKKPPIWEIFGEETICVFPKIGVVPQNGVVYNGKPYKQMDDLGGNTHYFRKHPFGPGNHQLNTPWKINMEPTNHPFGKENDLPNLHHYGPC